MTSAVRRVADGGDAMRRDAVEAMRRVYDAGGDAIRRAERDADEIATRAFRVALVTERKNEPRFLKPARPTTRFRFRDVAF